MRQLRTDHWGLLFMSFSFHSLLTFPQSALICVAIIFAGSHVFYDFGYTKSSPACATPIQTPAYASFTSDSNTSLLDLHEIVDISEDGIAIQCHSPLEVKKNVGLCLDLADCPEHIHTTGQVIWANESGRAGLRFSELSADALARLREWLFVNVMAGVANGETEIPDASADATPPRPSYTDTLAAVSAVQRQVESLGSDLIAALQLIAAQSKLLLHASGCAIGLADKDPEFMICRASAGFDAPPVGVKLQVGSGFSGECVKTGMVLRCDDSEVDVRVDRESCRALGIRSILAVPVRAEGKSIGLIEAFAADPNVFSELDGRVLHRFTDTILAAIKRTADDEDEPGFAVASAPLFSSPGSVLFPQQEQKDEKSGSKSDDKGSSISLPRSHILILACAAATIFLVLGFLSAPTLQSDVVPWLQAKFHPRTNGQIPTCARFYPATQCRRYQCRH